MHCNPSKNRRNHAQNRPQGAACIELTAPLAGLDPTKTQTRDGRLRGVPRVEDWTLPMARSGSYAPSTASEMTCSELPADDSNTFCDSPFWTASSTTRIPPETSVCTSCHDAPAVAAHAATNTTVSGVEACATCHGAGALYDVTLFHGLP